MHPVRRVLFWGRLHGPKSERGDHEALEFTQLEQDWDQDYEQEQRNAFPSCS